MRKVIFGLLAASALCLTACTQSVSPAAVKAGLENAGYRVDLMNKTEAEARISGIEWVVAVSDVVYTTKNDGAFIGFFCSNHEDAGKFVEANVSAMYHFAENYTEDPAYGYHNNLAYCGSKDAAKAAGIPVSPAL